MKETFLRNGGYIVKKETIFPFAEDVRYMDCSCGRQVRNVGENAESVKCSRCVDSNLYKQFGDEYKEKQERKFRKEVSKYIDEKIENEIVARAIKNGTIAKA